MDRPQNEFAQMRASLSSFVRSSGRGLKTEEMNSDVRESAVGSLFLSSLFCVHGARISWNDNGARDVMRWKVYSPSDLQPCPASRGTFFALSPHDLETGIRHADNLSLWIDILSVIARRSPDALYALFMRPPLNSLDSSNDRPI